MAKPYSSICYLTLLFLATNSYAENKNSKDLVIGKDFKHDVSLPLRDLQAKTDIIKHKYKMPVQRIILEKTSSLTNSLSIVPVYGFDGIGASIPNYPITQAQPDLNFAVGATQLIQYANPDIAVFNKSSHMLPGFPKSAASFWAGFGGVCEQYANGRLSTKYDEMANRWVVSQLAIQDEANGPFFNCTAVSTSDDVTGSYYRYAFQLNTADSNFLRLAVWPDAYYLGLTSSHLGTMKAPEIHKVTICALEREKMLQGDAASIICKPLDSSPLTPVTLLGSTLLPPVGTPGYFLGLNPPNSITLYKFYADFGNYTNTDVVPMEIPVDSYQPACQGTNGLACGIQPKTSNKLDVVNDSLLSSVDYREFPGGYGSMVATHSIDGHQQLHGLKPKPAPALRWYELRVDDKSHTRNPVVYQQATLEPDTQSRFAGSISIDPTGNIALAYTVSSSKVYPSSEMAWHGITDPLNTMTIQPLVTGTGSQIDDISAWTKTTKLVPDPFNPCKMWFTGEYLKADGSFNWETGLINFDLPCPANSPSVK